MSMLLVVLVLVILLAMGVPVAFAVSGAALLYFVTASVPDALIIQRMLGGIQPFPLLAIPFFIFAGVIMANGGIAKRLLGFADGLIGHRRGGLAQVSVMNSLIMGGMSGSGNADAAVDAKVLVPIMTKLGYDKSFSTALAVATGVIAPIIPPGIGLIVYGFLAQVSIGRLFVAGIIPGLLIAASLSVVVSLVSKHRGYGSSRTTRLPGKEIMSRGRQALWAFMMPVLLIVGLRLGVFTPTELGAMAVLYALVVSVFVYREISLRELPAVVRESVLATAVVVLILAAGSAFGWVMTVERVPQNVVAGLTAMTENPIVLLLMINVILLLLGAMIDGTALLVIVTPILAPVGAAIGVDPVHFGIIIVVNLTIGAITPPIGSILYTACGITGTTVQEYTKEIWPFLIALIGVLLVLTFVPIFSTLLPSLFFG